MNKLGLTFKLLNDNLSDADFCNFHGLWPGTLLAGDEGYGETIIRITALGENSILARSLSHAGVAITREENMWTLRNREWRVIKNQCSGIDHAIGGSPQCEKWASELNGYCQGHQYQFRVNNGLPLLGDTK